MTFRNQNQIRIVCLIGLVSLIFFSNKSFAACPASLADFLDGGTFDGTCEISTTGNDTNITITGDVVITSGTFTFSNSGTDLIIADGASLTIQNGAELTLVTNNNDGIDVNVGGHLEVQSGGTLRGGNNADWDIEGVMVSAGTVTMGNTGTGGQTDVTVDGGSVTVTGGTFDNGDDLKVINGGTFTVTGGTVNISDNVVNSTAGNGGGGGVSTGTVIVLSPGVLNASDINFDTTTPPSEIQGDGTITVSGTVAIEDDSDFTGPCTGGCSGDGVLSSGPVLWLRADAGTSTTTDATELVTWTDQSPSATSASNTGAPEFRDNTTDNLNFNPVVDLDGTNDFFSTAATGLIGDNNAYTMFVIADFDNTTIGALVGVDPGGSHLFDIEASGFPRVFHTGGYILTSPTSVSSTLPNLLAARFRGTSGGALNNIININGEEAVNNTATNGFLDGGSMQIGADFGTIKMDGRIAEVLVYNAELTDLRIDKIESYLAIKYGITIDQTSATDYVSNIGTVIWDATTNATYNNDIAGLGRDDAFSLNQLQSKSENSSSVLSMQSAGISADNTFMIWGHDGGAVSSDGVTDLPDGITSRIARVWRLDETNEVGSVDIQVDLSSIPTSIDASHLQLLIDPDGTFLGAGGTSISGATDLGSGIYEFAGVTDLDDGEYFSIGSDNATTPLPVELVSFSAKSMIGLKVKLEWATSSEINNDFFTVEKSLDQQSFFSVSRIEGAGNSNDKIEYNFIDYNPVNGISYYRLKQTDYDGTVSYSSVEMVHIIDEASFNIYPNPANEQLILEWPYIDTHDISIYDLLGKRINLPISLYDQQLVLSTSSLENGIYVIQIKSEEQQLHKRVMIEH